MDEHQEHQGHADHWHDSACGHESTQVGGHTDYMHDGHKHHEHDGHWDEHAAQTTTDTTESNNPSATTAF
jgi:hypothetical protein